MEEMKLEGETVSILEMVPTVKEEFQEEAVDNEIASLEAELSDIEGAIERRRQALQDRLDLLRTVKNKFQGDI